MPETKVVFYKESDIEDIIESLSGPVPAEIQAIIDKKERGESLTDEEQKMLDDYNKQKEIAGNSVKNWQAELEGNYAYRWRIGDFETISGLENAINATSIEKKQTISFSAGAQFEYVQTVTEGAFASKSESLAEVHRVMVGICSLSQLTRFRRAHHSAWKTTSDR